jgi:hypothetical protein
MAGLAMEGQLLMAPFRCKAGVVVTEFDLALTNFLYNLYVALEYQLDSAKVSLETL